MPGTGSAGQSPVGIGLVGAGAYGQFCLEAFAEMPEVRIVAVADFDVQRAKRMAARYNSRAYAGHEAMLENPAVEVVALNTPPYLHGPQGLEVIEAGRHLFCEKPLATTVVEGARLIEAARFRGVRLTVDYVMRHNPFWAAAAALAHSGVLGRLRHMDLTNHAAGLSLPADHWFWDKRMSGGIWIEHGVHCFDAFSWVSMQVGDVVGARSYVRGDGATDRVEGLFRYGDVAAHCYHAFDQSGATEQTTVNLTFEHGYVTLREWVPTSLDLLTPVSRSAWERYLPGKVEYTQLPNDLVQVKAYAPEGKTVLYRRSIQAGMRNMAEAVRDPKVPLAVTGEDGLVSLNIAAAAEART
jgi:predicted dehydrogenase